MLSGDDLPSSDILAQLTVFIQQFSNINNLEIEAKFGRMTIDQKRLNLGICSSTILIRPPDYSVFDSEIDVHMFRHINDFLNKRVLSDFEPNMSFRQRIEVNQQYNLKGNKGKLRVSYTEGQMEETKEIFIKTRLEDLHIIQPSMCSDIRVSASTEVPWNDPLPPGPPSSIRRKIRVSYTIAGWSIDLTEVQQYSSVDTFGTPSGPFTRSFELECELVDVDRLLLEPPVQNVPLFLVKVSPLAKELWSHLLVLSAYSNVEMPIPQSLEINFNEFIAKRKSM